MLPFPQDDQPIDGNRIRKQWHNGEWYYSVIDIIAVLLETDYKRAQSYWSTLKQRLTGNGHDLDILSRCLSLKLICEDKKQPLSDTTNLQGFRLLQKLLKPRQHTRSKRHRRGKDEIVNLHPLVLRQLELQGWLTSHNILLQSGKKIDIVAVKDTCGMVIECKVSLLDSRLFTAIGQVLCYCSEYNPEFQPALACPKSQIDSYGKRRCAELGIVVLDI